MTSHIDPELQIKIYNITYTRGGLRYLRLRRHPTQDEEREYRFLGIADRTVKLSYEREGGPVLVLAKIADRGNFYKLYAEAWAYIADIPKEVI